MLRLDTVTDEPARQFSQLWTFRRTVGPRTARESFTITTKNHDHHHHPAYEVVGGKTRLSKDERTERRERSVPYPVPVPEIGRT